MTPLQSNMMGFQQKRVQELAIQRQPSHDTICWWLHDDQSAMSGHWEHHSWKQAIDLLYYAARKTAFQVVSTLLNGSLQIAVKLVETRIDNIKAATEQTQSSSAAASEAGASASAATQGDDAAASAAASTSDSGVAMLFCCKLPLRARHSAATAGSDCELSHNGGFVTLLGFSSTKCWKA